MFKYENIQVLHNQGREVGGDDYNYYVVGGGSQNDYCIVKIDIFMQVLKSSIRVGKISCRKEFPLKSILQRR